MSDYRELPCRRCGRVWKWAFDKQSVPYCPEGYGCAAEPTIKESLEKILEKLDILEMKINRIPPVQPVYPTTPFPPSLVPTLCSKCGMKWEGVMGYVCSQSDCPVQLTVTSQTYNVSYTTGSFDIESPDPDERSWYYDGDGTKRKKE